MGIDSRPKYHSLQYSIKEGKTLEQTSQDTLQASCSVFF
jgi:hypothetical protein